MLEALTAANAALYALPWWLQAALGHAVVLACVVGLGALLAWPRRMQ